MRAKVLYYYFLIDLILLFIIGDYYLLVTIIYYYPYYYYHEGTLYHQFHCHFCGINWSINNGGEWNFCTSFLSQVYPASWGLVNFRYPVDGEEWPPSHLLTSAWQKHRRKSLLLKISHTPFIELGEIKLYWGRSQFLEVQLLFCWKVLCKLPRNKCY